MADAVSNSEQQTARPAPKRRRILDPSAIVSVPVYSNKVSSSLQLRPTAAIFSEEQNADDGEDECLFSPFSSRGPSGAVATLSDSEDDDAEHVEHRQERTHKNTEPAAMRCPSPPPESPVQKQSRQVKRKISEIDRKLRAVNSLLSPNAPNRRSRRRRDNDDVIVMNPNDDVIIMNPNDDDDVIVMNPSDSGLAEYPYSSAAREIPLKIRCRTDVHKIPVLSSTPLSDVLTQLSVTLKVPPPRLLLQREDVELPTDSTVGELGLGIADIIECVVMAAEDDSEAGGDIITVRLQSKDRDSSQEFSLRRDAPLGSVFSRFVGSMPSGAQRKVRFHFDGCKVTHRQTPAELDMEDGDIIEVWT